MDRFIKLALCIALPLIATNDHSANAQRVFSNSRAAASANPPRQSTATGGFSLGRTSGTRWGIPGQPSSSDWTLHPPNSNSRTSSTYQNHSSHHHGSTHYTVPPSIIHYSPYNYPQQYGNYGGPVIYGAPGYGYNNYGGLSPYDRVRLQNGLPLCHSNGYQSYVGIVTPPIVIPFGGSGNTYSLAPAPFPQPNVQAAVPSLPHNSLPAVPEVVGQTYSKKIVADERPLINEFQAQPPIGDGAQVGTVERIRSLRYQTSGDSEFRQQKFAAAVTLYEASAKTAPQRRAPWIRKAWAEVSLQQFDEAARSLKMAMLLPDDPTNSWIPGEQLYGNKFATDAALQNESLWQWLQQRPNSTDRLLLVAGFQQLQGYTGTARELINEALQKGMQQGIVDAFQQIINDRTGDAAQPNDQQAPPIEASDNTGIHDPNVVGAGQQIKQGTAKEIGEPIAVEEETPGVRIFAAPQPLEAQPAAQLPLTIPAQ
jgi:hypothetical protein